ncbi:MAG: hypothetical protein KAQ98_08005 [Bacteriovoracaceae bacterium]|nr:hypothetical protein [Bacteriovoracaceae bacterium]
MIELKEYSAKTDKGPYLQINEDDYDIDLSNKLFLIFDGFGGSNIGDQAVSFLKSEIKNFYTRFGSDPDSTFPFSYSYKYLIEGNALINSMQYAQLAIRKENGQKKELSERGGASAIAVALAENIMTFVSTGNCASYLYRNGFLNVITCPDTLKFSSKQNYRVPIHTCPMSGFGLFDDIYLQTRELRLFEDDLIILMTDGVYGGLGEDELKFIIDKKQDDSKKINELFTFSNERGNLDNQTVILLRF